jgi:hypothetical protein
MSRGCHGVDAKKRGVEGYALRVSTNCCVAAPKRGAIAPQRLFMRAIKKARRLIEAQPENAAAIVLSRLVVALESEVPFDLSALYRIDYKSFELALEVIAEWRLDRYYSGKAKLLGASVQLTARQTASDLPVPDQAV